MRCRWQSMALVDILRHGHPGQPFRLVVAADFCGGHLGLAGLVTAVVVIGIVPFLALQLKAVAMSYEMPSQVGLTNAAPWQDSGPR